MYKERVITNRSVDRFVMTRVFAYCALWDS